MTPTRRPEPSGIDPWAEAFAESSRAALTPRRSAYPIAVNPQVQRFLDRFTGARREVVNLWAGRAGRYFGMIRDVSAPRAAETGSGACRSARQ